MIRAKDYHGILGVSKKAGKDEIRRAYRRLAMLYHPDRNHEPGATERFKEINEAYSVLSGKEKAPLHTREETIDPDTAWAASVVRIWDQMMRENNNMYR